MTNEELALAYQCGDRDALLPLWVQVERLARSLIRRYLGLAHKSKAVDYDDLMQSAFLAAERAARTYREGADISFNTMLGYCVKREAYSLLGLRGRVRREHYEAVSTATPIGEDGPTTMGDMLEDESLPDPNDTLFTDDVQREVHAAINRLPERRAEAVRKHYLHGRQYRVIAAEIGVSWERVRQLVAAGRHGLLKDRRLRQLADEVVYHRHRGVAAFRRDWTSTVEAAVIDRERLQEKARGWGLSDVEMREIGL